jgi:uncharacterized membrane protein YdjX (TVP38/TMEM64 family)
MKQSKIILRYFLITLTVISFLIWGWLDNFSGPLLLDLTDPKKFIEFVRNSGAIGPLVIIFTLVIAIVFSPLPSAPIAMAAGAIYGHVEGAVYVFIGSLLGSSVAFGITRVLGFNISIKWLEKSFPNWRVGGHRRLMLLIMLSRLMPFISFDLVSYAAGITALSYGRFLFATAVGILPASFLLAHFGAEAMKQSLLINVVIVGVLVSGALLWRYWLAKSGGNN